MRRRDFLVAGSTGVAAAAAGARSQPQDPSSQVGVLAPERLADIVLATAPEELTALAVGWHRSGASVRDLLGAALLAGVREINPSPIGGQVHAMMMVQSASCIAARLRGSDALLPALFNLDRVKHGQARDQGRGDWTMPAAPAVDQAPTSTLSRDFEHALAAWNAEEADRLAVALHRHLAIDEFFEPVWWAAIRDYRVIGHKAIYAAQAHRALADLGWRAGRDVVRSVLLGVLDQNPYQSTTPAQARPILALLPANKSRAEGLPAGRLDPHAAGDPQQSRELCAAMRSATPDRAAEELVAAANTGASAATAWDSIRLRAFEQTLRLPTIAGVHPVTTTNALHYIARTAHDPLARRTALLQAASWMSLFEELVASRGETGRLARRVDTVTAGGAAADPFASGDESERTASAARLLQDGNTATFTRRIGEVLVRKAQHDHDYKFAAAVVEELEFAAPELRPQLGGAAMSFLRHDGDGDSAIYERAMRLL
ncbi:MAG: hypothetical protein KDE27_19465 [Planctomycetes bacterium]|nr:hypothetical protein [Planctomycetota bacterium]